MDLLATPLLCLALNVYYEARSEPESGQLAVSLVVLNRVKSKRYPDTICNVIKEKHQFSWYWDGKSDSPKDPGAWVTSVQIANIILDYNIFDITEGALYYHTVEICKIKEHEHKKGIYIGNHVFY